MSKRFAVFCSMFLLGACTSLVGPEHCRFRVALLPGETELQAIAATIPQEVIDECALAGRLIIDWVLILT